ncbi:hypothetical protein EJ04DRAFT_538671 [Polyplosphaeria fusca]|uniref:Centromere protein H C-terminal domain-containing protein n=1 Tax=Polyplosphaeria fusca TaxID=682080 RepID=A0A9P4QN91_9PLEO|nr:hypothetical protein EJ04DRAFT_538671 [Polyplosphaeria fusca]
MNDQIDTVMAEGGAKPVNSSDYADLLEAPHSDAFAFSSLEQQALHLYDQLRDFELQQSLLKSQNKDDALQEQLIAAEREAMDAKGEYELRNQISHNVLAMEPVLKAVHGGEQTASAEKRLLPLVTERDTVSMVHASLASKLSATSKALRLTEKANLEANAVNKDLSQTILALAEEMRTQSLKDVEDPDLHKRITAVEKDARKSRRQMKVLKGVLANMIVGSGIDWAEDEVLRELVMDDEEDD